MIELDGETVTKLLDVGDGRRLGCARIAGGARVSMGGAIAWLVIERGCGTVDVDGVRHAVDGRDDVFARPGWSAVLGPGARCALDGDLDVTVVWRAADGRVARTRMLDPAGVVEEHRGNGPTARTVRTYLASGALVGGETLNPPGGWSSWPPHTHEHEELYLYRFDPPDGFGVHVDLAGVPRVVRDGDVVRITAGEHPVVAAPGFRMYYLWALAGDRDELTTVVDPRWR